MTPSNWADGQYEIALGHLKELARTLRTEVRWVRKPEAWAASAPERMAWLPKPLTPYLYLVALHELGHIGSTTARRLWSKIDDPGLRIVMEGAAWAWAMLKADPCLAQRASDEDWANLGGLFGTYLRWTADQAAAGADAV